jgi:serine/threonine protein kinase/tetratricopeptide (TPR) repeat protein
MSDQPKRDVEVFAEVIQLPPEEYSAYLDRVCAGDLELRAQVESLLKVHDRVGDFLDRSPSEDIKRFPQIGEKAGDMIGRYKLLGQIGEGGCGVVYLAEQEEPVRRRVALKIVKPGMDTESVIARFEAERQALALMDHPNIAKVFDAGATASGRPFFVMELVRGLKITEYCDKHSLTTKERLQLFIEVCHAIQHAHQKGIIHRDIKPSNILVTKTFEGAALPVVIDFGIAKATTNQRLADKTVFTAFEMLVGTPAYMSPEQAALRGVDVDTRTDIYSLGVLLYELLTGSTPFNSRELLKVGLDEIRRIIREQEPARPSTCLSKMKKEELTSVAQHRKSDPPELVHAISGDLDWIAMKALEKDRTRRYASANVLALDVQCFLANEAIFARPPSQVYRFQKLVSRNRLLFGAMGVIVLLLVGSLVVVSLTLSKERRERQSAVTASVKSQQVVAFLEDMLNRAGPQIARGRDSTMMLEILNETTMHLKTELTDQPAVEADLRDLIGKLYEQMGMWPQAEEMEHTALAIRQREFGADSPEVAESLNDLGLEFMAEKKYPEAEKAHAQALAIRRQRLGDENTETATSLNDLAAAYRDQGKLKEAEAMAQEALRVRRKLLPADHVDIADSLRNLSMIEGSEGKWADAKKMAELALEMRRKVLGPDHPFVADSLEDVAWAASGMGQYDEAEKLDAQALVLRDQVHGDAHPDIGRTLNALGQILSNRGDLPTSDAVLKATLAIQRKLLGEDNQSTLDTLDALGRVLKSEGKTAEAEAVLRETLEVWRKRGDDDNKQRLMTMRDLGEALEHEGRWPEAEAIWRESLPLWRKRGGKEEKESMYTLRTLGLALIAEHNWPEAESVFREAFSISRQKGDGDPEALSDLQRLVGILFNEKKFADAQDLLDKVLTPASIAQPSNANLLAAKVSINARRGRWREALADATLALKNEPTDHYRYHVLAGLLALTHDRPGYEKICQELFTNFADTLNPYVAERVAQDCLLLDHSEVNLALVDKLADTAVTRGAGEASLPYFQACKAMASYRMGRFAQAIEWADKAVKIPTVEAQAKAKALAILAMANWQLGQKNEARAALAQGDALAPPLSPEHDQQDLGDSWVAWIQARISLDEATGLIQGRSIGDDTLKKQ